MAIINSYPNITELKTDSLLLVSDTSVEGNPTKTTPISDIVSLIPGLVPGGGTVTSVTSGDVNTITIGGTATDPTVAANTAAVIDGGNNLATGDQIFDFVKAFVDNNAVTSVQSGSTGTISISGSTALPLVSAITAAVTDGSTALATGDQIYDFVTGLARPYLVYSALITQTGTNAPTDVVLENTIPGTLTWSRNSVGTYILTSNGTPFTANKVQVFLNGGSGNTGSSGGSGLLYANRWESTTTDTIAISTSTTGAAPQDGNLTNASIEIRIYS